MLWVTTFEVTFNAVDNAWENYTLRNTLTPALVESDGTIPDGATHVRITFRASTNENLKIDNAFIGHVAGAGDAYDAADLTRITFNGGSNSVNITQNTEVTSDEIAFTYDQVSNLIITIFCPNDNLNTGGGQVDGITGWQTYYRSGGDFSAVLDTASHSSATSGRVNMVNKIEFGAPDEGATVFKNTAYSVLDRMETADVFKAAAYSVLVPPPPAVDNALVYKATAYSVLGHDGVSARAFKGAAYSVLAPNDSSPAEAYKYSYLPVVN